MGTGFDAGQAKLRDLQDVCDLCGTECDGSAELCVTLTCHRCAGGMFHQKCLEKFLKKHGYASDRKTGFPCPMGRGKGTRIAEECKSKVEKSHPIVPRNEEKRKKAVAPPLAEVLAKQPKHEPDKKQQPTARKQKPPKINVINAHLAAHKSASPAVARPNAWQDNASHHTIRVAPVIPAQPSPDSLISPEDQQQEAKAAHVPVGWSLDDALTKAQKKNLQRRKKKQQMLDAASEATEGSADHTSLDELMLEQATSAANNGAGPSSSGASSSGGGAAAALDPSQMLNSNKFVTKIEDYYRLLALHGAVLSDDEDEAAMNEEDDEQEPAAVTFEAPAVHTPQPQMPVAALSSLTAPPSPAAPPTDALSDEDNALQAALAASQKEFELEQEMQRQREILAQAPPGMYNSLAKEAGYSPKFMALADGPLSEAQKPQIPAAAVIAPVAVPVMVPAAQLPTPPVVPELPRELPAPAGKESVVQQFFQPAGFGNLDAPQAPAGITNRTAFSSGHNGQQQLQPPGYTGWQQQQHSMFSNPVVATAKFTSFGQAPGSHGADGSIASATAGRVGYQGGYAPMTAGHHVVATAADDDDDLTSLLQLCGVAG